MSDKKKILFIDDNLLDRAFIESLLLKEGFDVVLAEDGQQGIQASLDHKPDLILLDFLLPHMSGIDVCKKIKANPITFTTPVLFYTSADTPKDLLEYASYGAVDCLPKNMPPKDLIAAIRRILSLR